MAIPWCHWQQTPEYFTLRKHSLITWIVQKCAISSTFTSRRLPIEWGGSNTSIQLLLQKVKNLGIYGGYKVPLIEHEIITQRWSRCEMNMCVQLLDIDKAVIGCNNHYLAPWLRWINFHVHDRLEFLQVKKFLSMISCIWYHGNHRTR